VANPRKLRLIYANKRKADEIDAENLARLARVDPKLRYLGCRPRGFGLSACGRKRHAAATSLLVERQRRRSRRTSGAVTTRACSWG